MSHAKDQFQALLATEEVDAIGSGKLAVILVTTEQDNRRYCFGPFKADGGAAFEYADRLNEELNSDEDTRAAVEVLPLYEP